MTSRWRGEGAQHQGARPYQEDSWALKPLADGSLLAVLAVGTPRQDNVTIIKLEQEV